MTFQLQHEGASVTEKNPRIIVETSGLEFTVNNFESEERKTL